MIIYEIPLRASAQKLTVTLNNVSYVFTIVYRDTEMGGWTLDVADIYENNLVTGIPITPGRDIFGQYNYLGILPRTSVMFTQTDGGLDIPPTYANLGIQSHLYYAVL